MRLSPWLAKLVLYKGPLAAKQAWEEREARKLNPGSIEPTKRTKSTRIGSAVDRIVFNIGDEIVIKERRGQLELPGQILLTEKENELARWVADKVWAFWRRTHGPAIKNQQKLVWACKDTGVQCSATPDSLDFDLFQVNDLKTSYDVSDEAIKDSIRRYGYDIQAAACIDAAQCVLGWDKVEFRNVFVCTKEPFEVRFWPHGPELEYGSFLWATAKLVWAECLRTGVYTDKALYEPPKPRFRNSSKTVDEFLART